MATLKTAGTLAFCAFIIAGCASAMPSSHYRTAIGDLPWKSFEDADSRAKKIEIGKTTLAELKTLGFDFAKIPNIEIIEDVRIALLPRTTDTLESLPVEAQLCYRYFVECKGYIGTPGVTNTKGVGNIILRISNFKREDVTTGWQFKFHIFFLKRKYVDMVRTDENATGSPDELVVVYVSTGGKPKIEEIRSHKNPLAPLEILFDSGRKISPYPIPALNNR